MTRQCWGLLVGLAISCAACGSSGRVALEAGVAEASALPPLSYPATDGSVAPNLGEGGFGPRDTVGPAGDVGRDAPHAPALTDAYGADALASAIDPKDAQTDGPGGATGGLDLRTTFTGFDAEVGYAAKLMLLSAEPGPDHVVERSRVDRVSAGTFLVTWPGAARVGFRYEVLYMSERSPGSACGVGENRLWVYTFDTRTAGPGWSRNADGIAVTLAATPPGSNGACGFVNGGGNGDLPEIHLTTAP